jgi:hypothetical protein
MADGGIAGEPAGVGSGEMAVLVLLGRILEYRCLDDRKVDARQQSSYRRGRTCVGAVTNGWSVFSQRTEAHGESPNEVVGGGEVNPNLPAHERRGRIELADRIVAREKVSVQVQRLEETVQLRVPARR